MLTAVVFFALVPVVIAAGSGQNPLLINAAMRLGIALLLASILLIRFRNLLQDRETWRFLARRAATPEMAAILISYLDFAILGFAFRFIDPAAGAVIYEIWPIVLTLIVHRFTGQRYQPLNRRTLLLIVGGFAGVALVLAGQTGGATPLGQQLLARELTSSLTGAGLALTAALVTALTGFSWVWTHNSTASKRLPPRLAMVGSRERNTLELFLLLIALVVANAAAALVNATLGVAYGALSAEWADPATMALMVLGGAVSYGIASALWRLATTQTDRLGIHALSYATPLLAVCFLSATGLAGDISLPWLLAGAGVIIGTNVASSLQPGRR